MGLTQGPYILQLCMGPSYFSGVWDWPILTPRIRTLMVEIYLVCFNIILGKIHTVNFQRIITVYQCTGQKDTLSGIESRRRLFLCKAAVSRIHHQFIIIAIFNVTYVHASVENR